MKDSNFKKQLMIVLGVTGITWLIMSIMIFVFIKTPFTWDRLFYYFLVSVLIGAYVFYLQIKGQLFSKVFFGLAYFVSFFGLYFGATSASNNFGNFAAVVLMVIPLITISALGYMIDLNLANKKKAKQLKKGS